MAETVERMIIEGCVVTLRFPKETDTELQRNIADSLLRSNITPLCDVELEMENNQ